MNTVAVAYSYLRFSSTQQSHGDSIRRQTELRDAWLAKHRVTLDTSISLRDEGKSAFTGEHRRNPDRHALAAFLQLVEKGRIPKGSYLIVENLDRLSREHIQPALILFLNLLQAGVRVVQLLPVEAVYDDKSESMNIMMAIMELSRGHSESVMKSERIGRAWADLKRRAATEKIPITPMVPSWLRVEGDRIVTIPERAAVVKKIFRLVTEGHGLVAICRKLNADGVPTFGRSKVWNPSTAYKVAHSRAAVGEYQPYRKKGTEADGDPIPGYFPQVVTDAQFWAAQAALKSRHEGGRRTIRQFNPFAGLLHDARDGEKMYVTGPGARSNHTLVSYGASRGKPNSRHVSFPLRPFVEGVLSQLRELRPSDVIGEDDAADEVAALSAHRVDLESRVATLQSELESGDGEIRAAVAALRKLEMKLQEVIGAEAVARAKAASPVSTAIGDIRGVIDLALRHDNDDTRARLKTAVRRVVSQALCLFVAHGRSRVAAVQVFIKDTEQCRGYLLGYTQGRGNAQVKTPAKWWVRSYLELNPGKFDLRNKAHVAALERQLAKLAPDTFAAPTMEDAAV